MKISAGTPVVLVMASYKSLVLRTNCHSLERTAVRCETRKARLLSGAISSRMIAPLSANRILIVSIPGFDDSPISFPSDSLERGYRCRYVI
jgi:hypothetical protein